MLGAIILFVYTIMGNIKFIGKIRYRRPIIDPKLTELFSQCLSKMNIGRSIQLEKINSIQIPMLYGWLKPAILLPDYLIQNWTPNQFKHIICHELAHYKRNDILIAQICTMLQILHWFNPLIWFAFYKIRQDREVACDAIALNHLGRDQSKPYGSTLISLLENISFDNLMPLTVGIAESKKNLKQRLIQINRYHKPKMIWTIFVISFMMIISCALFTEAKKDQTHISIYKTKGFTVGKTSFLYQSELERCYIQDYLCLI